MPHVTWRHRARGAALALLVQVSFLLLLLLPSQHHLPMRPIEHEAIFLLPPLKKSAPHTIDARGTEERPVAQVPIPSVPSIALSVPGPPVLGPPSGIAGFGRSLFGCAPEHYADLTPDERAHCPKPGEGMAKSDDNDLATPPRSHAKDELLWQEQWAEEHYVPAVCPLGDGPGAVAHCVMEQAKAENHRRADAWQKIEEQKAARLQPPKRPVPKIGVRRN